MSHYPGVLLPSFLSRMRRSGGSWDFRTVEKWREPVTFPLNFKGKSAVFEGGPVELERLRSEAPEALAVPVASAMELAEAKLRGELEVPALTFAIVVFTESWQPRLNDSQRDRLWRAFRVPIFEQVRSADGIVIARECETHDGLHLTPGAGVRVEEGELWIGDLGTGLPAAIDSGHCECGDESPRLKNSA